MNVMSPPAPSHTGADSMAADAACYAGMLRELAEMGMDVAREMHRQVTVPEAEAAGDDAEGGGGKAAPARVEAASRAFDRAARCVRRTILLAHTISKPPPARAPDECSRTSARRYIIRALEDGLHSEVSDQTQRDALTAEVHERLDGPDVADDLDGRPLRDIIREIRRDLGLDTLPGSQIVVRRTPQDIAVLCARAMEPRVTQAAPGQRPPDATREGEAAADPAEAERFFRLLARP